MSTKYKLRITGECKQNMKLCKRRGLPMDELSHSARLAAYLGDTQSRACPCAPEYRYTF